jgi:hypothetical protein
MHRASSGFFYSVNRALHVISLLRQLAPFFSLRHGLIFEHMHVKYTFSMTFYEWRLVSVVTLLWLGLRGCEIEQGS